jgi:hypothetical protein
MSAHDDDGLDGLVARLQTKLQAATGIVSEDLLGMVDTLIVDARLARKERDAALTRTTSDSNPAVGSPPSAGDGASLFLSFSTAGIWAPLDGEL